MDLKTRKEDGRRASNRAGATGDVNAAFASRNPLAHSQADAVADFLREKRITIVPEPDAPAEPQVFRLAFVARDGKEICNLRYNKAIHSMVPPDTSELMRRVKAPDDVMDRMLRPTGQLLYKNRGAFYSADFFPIHEACDAVEATK
jgi:hypothetical protein